MSAAAQKDSKLRPPAAGVLEYVNLQLPTDLHRSVYSEEVVEEHWREEIWWEQVLQGEWEPGSHPTSQGPIAPNDSSHVTLNTLLNLNQSQFLLC